MTLKSIIISWFNIFIFLNIGCCQQYDAEVIRFSKQCEVIKNTLIQTDSVTLQINNKVGDKYSEIEIPYSRMDKLSNVEAWIEDMNGRKIRILKKDEITERSDISDMSLYEDDYVKSFQLRHNQYPYKVRYTYKYTQPNFITLADWTPRLHKKIPTYLATLTVIVPKGYEYSLSENNLPDFKKDSIGNKILLEWKGSYEKPLKDEIFSQPNNVMPFVIVTPTHFDYGIKGCAKDWKTYGDWFLKLNEGLDILPDAEKNTISELIIGIKDQREIVKIIYHYMQDHTRYINVKLGIGGFKSYPASYVAQNKYGDCKALSNYLKSMLKYVGIESYYTLIQADVQPFEKLGNFVYPKFNHVILAVPLNHDTIWLENTSNISPFGYIGTSIQHRKALLISEDSSHLVQIPSLTMEDNHQVYRLEFNLSTKKDASFNIQCSLKGEMFEMFNSFDAEMNADEKNKIIREKVIEADEINEWKLKKFNRDTPQIELTAQCQLNQFLSGIGDEYYFCTSPIGIPSFKSTLNRMLPVELPYPIYHTDTLVYHLPEDYILKTNPEPISIKSTYGHYEIQWKVIQGQVTIIKNLTLYPGTCPIDQYPFFYNFIQQIKDKEKQKIVIKPLY